MSDPQQNNMDRFAADRRDQAQGLMDMVTSQLERAAASDTPVLPEHIFQGVYLPMFAGDENLTYPVDIDHWIGRVSHDGFRPVNVVDRKGTVLFTVPPVYDRAALDVKLNERGTQSVAHLVQSAQQYAQLSPRVAAEYLHKHLTDKALVMQVPDSVRRHLQTWNEIFARYGRPPLAESPTVGADGKIEEKKDGPTAGGPLQEGSDFEFEV